MKELSIEEKAKRFDEALAMAKECITYIPDDAVNKYMLNIFPELKGSDDEEVRKAMIDFFKHEREEGVTVLHYGVNIERMIAWLEKQGQQETDGWKEGNIIRHGGILALVIKGRRAMKSNGEIFTVQYPDEWVKAAPNEIEHFLNEFEKQGEKIAEAREQKPTDYENATIVHKDFAPKSAIEAAKEEKIDNANKVEPKDYNSIDPHFGKPADKVEPKFHEGEWIVWQNKCYKVYYNGCGYELIDQDGLSTSLEYGTIDESAHLWDVTKDAKDGDMLCYENEISIYKHDIKNCTKQETTFGGFVYYCCYDGKRFIMDSLYSLTEQDKMAVHPATKEQCDTLFAKMKEAGYTFD